MFRPEVREVGCQMTDRGKDDSREARKQDKGQGEKAEASWFLFFELNKISTYSFFLNYSLEVSHEEGTQASPRCEPQSNDAEGLLQGGAITPSPRANYCMLLKVMESRSLEIPCI